MLLISFTPFRFLFLLNYLLVLILIFNCNRLIIFWLLIEVFNFFFVRMAYSIKLKSIRALILFFLMQVFFSFGILFMCLLKQRFLLTLFLIIKLALFPFIGWFIQTLVFFPFVLTLLSFTLNKIPIFLILFKFSLTLNWFLLSLRLLFSLLFRIMIVFYRTSSLILLLYSSIGGNAWLILSIEVSYFYFLMFIRVYFLSLICFISKILSTKNEFYLSDIVLIYFLNLASLPPFPLFLIKVFIVMSLLVSNLYLSILCFILVISVFISAGYVQFFLKSILYSQSWM